MRLLRFAAVMLGFVVISASSHAAATNSTYFPICQKSPPNCTDTVLLYQGGRQRSALSPEELAPYVSYIDPRDHKEKWLFDGFLFIEYVNGKKHAFEEGLHLTEADKADWLDLLDRNFEAGHGVPALEQACAQTERRIGRPLRPRQIVLTLPEPIEGATNWGELDGRKLNFSTNNAQFVSDRVAASTWFVERALERWRQFAPKHLVLAGFYFVPERTLGSNPTFLPRIAEAIHQRGYLFYWIPYWWARGAGDWKKHGFDVAWQQPNHFFHPELPDSRLTDACKFAREHGMGMEFELDDRIVSKSETFAPRFDAYLKAFEREGAKAKASIAYYEGGGALLHLAQSKDATMRAHYDRLAQWVLDRQSVVDKTVGGAGANK
ncbi:MAG: DUF4855 domain-containing protein [Limisphaerales bacterium]